MAKPKEGTQLEPEQTQAPDWLDRLVDEMYARMEEGERPAPSFPLERLLEEVMERERQRFLAPHKGSKLMASTTAGSTSHWESSTSRSPGSTTPNPSARDPPPRWKRVDKDYEELLIAMLANGHSRAQLERALNS